MSSSIELTMKQDATQATWTYRYADAAVYVSADGGATWRLFMYFPER